MLAIIRPYQAEDFDGLMSSWENASRVAHPFLSEDFLDEERHNIPNLYLPNTDTWVAELDGRVVGFLSLLNNEVGAIFVEPNFHGQGIGKGLMDKAQDLHGTLELDVFEANRLGRRFYERYGFQFVSSSVHEPTVETVFRLRFEPGPKA